MRCLVISDIHANLPAFQTVMDDAKARSLKYDIVWCLGDVVGYGPEPNECIEDALPYASVKNGSIVSTTRGSQRVVALLSR